MGVLIPVPRLGGSGGPEVFSDGAFEAIGADVFVRFGSGGGLSESVPMFDCEGVWCAAMEEAAERTDDSR